MATLHVRNFPEPLYEALRACAEAEGRSIGAQAIVLLESAVVPGRRQRAWLGGRRRSTGGGAGFGRFTEKGREVVVRAQDAARAFEHGYVGTEHVLLGLLQVDASLAARALKQLRVDEQTVQGRIEEIVGRGSGTPPGAIPFTPRTKKVLELALREALELRHDYIGTEHLLLAIVKEGEGVAARILREREVEEPHVRGVVLGLLGREPGREPSSRLELQLPETTDAPAYRALDLQGSAERWTEQLNELADEGWELVSLQQLATGTRAVLRGPD